MKQDPIQWQAWDEDTRQELPDVPAVLAFLFVFCAAVAGFIGGAVFAVLRFSGRL